MINHWNARRLWRVMLFTAVIWAAWMSSRAGADDGQRPTGSLFQSAQQSSLVSDFRAFRVGDTLTILVQETATANSAANTKGSRAESGAFSGLTSSVGVLNRLLKPFNASTSEKQDGQGSTNRTGSITTRLTATVKEVLPNGNLLIEATRTIGINAEKQKVMLRGVVRPVDISSLNTISSVQIADADIKYDGKGPVGDRQKKGILSTVLGWIF